jgi:hypothetical protein
MEAKRGAEKADLTDDAQAPAYPAIVARQAAEALSDGNRAAAIAKEHEVRLDRIFAISAPARQGQLLRYTLSY